MEAEDKMSLTNYFKNRRFIKAVREEDFQRAIQLAERGADVNIIDPETGWPPLMFAVMRGSEKTVKAFLSLKPECVVSASTSHFYHLRPPYRNMFLHAMPQS